MNGMQAPVRRTIRYGSADIAFTVTTRPRRNLAITVRPDLGVTVVSPPGNSIQQIEAKVRGRAAWILRQQLRFRDLHPLPAPRRYVSGETHRYLGRQYRLKISTSTRDYVAIRRPYLVVEVKGAPTPDRVRTLLLRWYRGRAEITIRKEFDRFRAMHPSLDSPDTRLRFRTMANRWGSCAPNGTITLNPELARVPTGCIEYVIAHELCHRKVMNHGADFERLLSRLMPDWRSRRERLNRAI